MKVIYPGTFDPVTNGHLNLIERTHEMFDEVVIGVAASPSKNTMFTLEERVALMEEVVAHLPGVTVKGFSGLLVDFARQEQAKVLIRGLRTTVDFEYEFGLTNMYRKLLPGIESVFLTPEEEFAFYLRPSCVKLLSMAAVLSSSFPRPLLTLLRRK